MAFDSESFYTIGPNAGRSRGWRYDTVDSQSVVGAAGYFDEVRYSLRVGDSIEVNFHVSDTIWTQQHYLVTARASTVVLALLAGGMSGGVINVKDYGAVGDGVTNDAQAFQAAINAAGEGDVIMIPVGTMLINAGVAVSAQYVAIRGVGRDKSVIQFGGVTGTAITFANSIPSVVHGPNEVSGLTIKATGNTSGTKVALNLVDQANSLIYDFSVRDWTGGDSTAVQYRGRQHTSFHDIKLYAALPFRIMANPNSTGGILSADFLRIEQAELVSTAAPSTLIHAAMLADDGANITNLHVETVSFVNSTHGFYQAQTGAPAWESHSLTFKNCRKEGGASASGYSFHVSYPSAVPCRNLTIEGSRFEINTGQGVYAENVSAVHIDNCNASGVTNTNTINVSGAKVLQISGMYVNNTSKALVLGSTMARVWAVYAEGAACPIAGVFTGFGNSSYLPADRPRADGRTQRWTWAGSLADDTSLEIMNNSDGHIVAGTVIATGSCASAAGGGIWHIGAKAIGTNGVLLLAGTQADDADTDTNLIVYSNTAALGGAIYLRNRLGAAADIVLSADMKMTAEG